MTGSSVVRPPIISPLVPWFTLGCSPTVQLSLCGFRWRRTIRSSSPARTDDNFPPPRTQRISNLDEKPPHHKTKQRHTVMMWTFSLVTLLSVLQLSSSWVSMPPAERRATSLHSSVSLVEFSKYEGLGNDFILIDDRDKDTPSLTPEQSEKLCNRNFGVGGDGVIFALKPPSDQYDFAMRIYNSDGSEPEMCGNGIRCFAQFLKDLGAEAESYRVNTLAGTIIPVMNKDGTITVDMGEPILEGSKVPTTLKPNFEGDSVVEQTLECNGKTWKISAVSMGNPHAIIFVDDLEKDIDFGSDGPALESCVEAFPARTNVEFVQVMSDTHLKMKVWERGAGPTLACGTGTCALVVAAIRAGKIPAGNQVRVTLPGGDLFIEWNKDTDNKVFMTGPATFAFGGKAALK